ncbi:AzlC family ABC transporter permease [Nocardia goodfellowii]|uniref:4-azaleucine resistance transporter AzlC n=1 Tax=Nocardia goodfellowii TaxID=882446 RepID=A0ABS4QSZ1_9NOCA|nr:AzlC family ABC transporter permease [Nocardia goodfellowii]MBP2194198.1 4-azaleucine resistance transporter AzlC [Nocardia goodfellowii]
MRSIWRTLGRDTASGVAAVLLAVWVIGLSYGATAVSSGFPIWLPVVLSFAVLAGGAEFLFIGIIAGGGSPIAAVLAGLVVNARHLPYGLSVPDDVVGKGWRRALGVHVMNDESVAMALAESDTARKRVVYWVCGLGVLLAWPGGAVLGALIGSVVPDTSALGLDAVFPAVLLALVVPALRDRTTLGSVCVGVVVAMLSSPFLPAGMPVLVALSGVLWAAFRTRGEADGPVGSEDRAPMTDVSAAADEIGTIEHGSWDLTKERAQLSGAPR